MKIINENYNIEKKHLENILIKKKIDYLNKEIYVFVYNFIDFLNLSFLKDIDNFILNKNNLNNNILVIYQNTYGDEYILKQEFLYIELLKLIKIKYPEIEYILYD